MKTPEEIKKGLACLSITDFMKQYEAAKSIAYTCVSDVVKDALDYIQQLEAGIDHAEKVARECAKSITENLGKLESRLAQVERERDAAVRDLSNSCAYCIHMSSPVDEPPCTDCFQPKNGIIFAPITRTNFEWRGVCEANTEEDGNV